MVNKTKQPEGCIGISEKCVFAGKNSVESLPDSTDFAQWNNLPLEIIASPSPCPFRQSLCNLTY